MKKASAFLSHLLGFEKLSRFEREYLHNANSQSSLYMGYLVFILELWLLIRQAYTKVIPQYQEGRDLFHVIITNMSRYMLLLLFGLGFALFNVFRQRPGKMTRKQFIALMISGTSCILYTYVLRLESFIKESETITATMANIANATIVISYVFLFLFGISIVIYSLFKYYKNKTLVILEHLGIILFTLLNLAFGVLVSYTDFWGGKEIICFLMMVIYVGCLLIYRPYITFLILGSSFYTFYKILLTFQGGVTFKDKEIIISGVTHRVMSGETINYITFFISLSTICTAIYHGRLKEARKTYGLEAATIELERKHKEVHEQFVQTAKALASAIDAKDPYTNGHSMRVAEYSRRIAEASGKSEDDCEKIFYAALLHDVGKIGVRKSILSKTGRLTNEEFEQIKQHPIMGGQILSSIHATPWLSIGAKYHHERYNGKGYPDGLKGEEIPEIARIIAVADAYDAMTSNRSYRKAIPQHIVREELVKGTGTQFDPDFARIMIHLIDLDIEYNMKESISGDKKVDRLRCESIYNDCTDGIPIARTASRIRLCCQPDDGFPKNDSLPTIIVFDSLDEKVHPGEENNKDLLYHEYAKIRLDGKVTAPGVRKSEVRFSDDDIDIERAYTGEPVHGQRFKIDTVRNRDHVLIHVSAEDQMFDVILALPDTSRYTYISLSGEHCELHNIMVDNSLPEYVPAIPRIAEEISYIRGCPVGDIPNVEVDEPRFAISEGIPIFGEMTLSFHTVSYPTARLVWHCPFFCIFTSANGQPDGADYHEYLLLKLDGESWKAPEKDDKVDNKVSVEKTAGFDGWNSWIEKNKQGLDCSVNIRREDSRIIIQTENAGIAIKSVTTLPEDGDTNEVYLALTGDQCAVTDIRIKRQ